MTVFSTAKSAIYYLSDYLEIIESCGCPEDAERIEKIKTIIVDLETLQNKVSEQGCEHIYSVHSPDNCVRCGKRKYIRHAGIRTENNNEQE